MKMYRAFMFTLLLSLVHISLIGQQPSLNEAENLIRKGEFLEAISLLDLIIENNQTNEKAYITRAIAHGNLRQFDKKNADLAYAKYLNPFAYMYLSNAFRSMHYIKKKYGYDYDMLNNEFEKSPMRNKTYDKYVGEIIEQHAQDSLISEAIYQLSENNIEKTELILSTINSTPKIEGILYDLQGLIALRKNNLDVAIAQFTKSIEKMPTFSLAYHNRAVAHKLQGNFEAARNDVEFAIALNEDISVFYFTLAKLSESLDEKKRAKSYYQKALEKDPDYIEARTNFSLLQKTLGNYDESMLDLQNIADTTDKNSKAAYIQGGIHLTYGAYENAIEAFDEYLEFHPKDSDALFNRGLAKLLQGNKEQGCNELQESLEINFNDKRSDINKAFCDKF